MIKFSKEQDNRLLCITGQCEHTFASKKCLWNKITEASNPDKEMEKEIRKLISDVVKFNTIKTKKK